MAKWRNFSFRSTLAGSWALVDPNDADNTTTPVYAANDPNYVAGTLSSDGIHVYGKYNNAQTFADTSQANAGSNPLLGGRLGLTSVWAYQIDAQPGTYDVRMAFGSGTAGTLRNVLAVFAGTYNYVSSVITTGVATLWTTGTAYALNAYMISKTDKSVWKATTAGTSGAVEPSGAGPTFNDGSVVWTRQALDALHIIDGSTTAANVVVDQNSTAVLASNWSASAPVTLTIPGGAPGNAFTLLRLTNSTTYLKQFSARLQQPTLVDVVIADDKDVDVTASPSIYAAQPEGYRTFKLLTTAGASTAAAFSLSGDLAPYFDVVSYGGGVWLATKALRVPESLVGTRSLTITQTDAEAVVTTHDTVLSVTVLSALGRPEDGSMLGRVLSSTYVKREGIRAEADTGIWPGYTNQTISPGNDYTVTGSASFLAAIAAIAPDGSSWYRIRVQNGTYTGTATIIKDFGTGGLLIEPAPGHDPEWDIALTGSSVVHGLHVRGIKSSGIAANMGGQLIQWRFADPGASGIGGSGRSNRLKFDSTCRFGPAFSSTAVIPDAPLEPNEGATIYIYVTHGDSVEISNCVFDGASGVAVSGVREYKFCDNDLQRPLYDVMKIGQQEFATSTPQLETFNYVARNNFRNENDFVDRGTEPHVDFIQIGTPLQNMSFWFANKGSNVNVQNPNGEPWTVGEQVLKTDAGGGFFGRVYEAVAVTGSGNAGATGPTGTANGQVDGDVTWDYVADYSGGIVTRLLMEDNTVQSKLVNGTRSGIQFLIDSTGGWGNEVSAVIINNSQGSNTGRGVQVNDGEVFAEFNTFGFPSESADYATSDKFVRPTLQLDRGYMLARNNVLAQDIISTDAKRAEYDNTVVDWFGSAIAPNRPADVMAGPFVLQDKTVDTWSYPSLDSSATPTASAFREQQRAILLATVSWLGAQTTFVDDAVVDPPDEPTLSTIKQAVKRGIKQSIKRAI
jgi:hypothetical protein